jgi:hypothetical protein
MPKDATMPNPTPAAGESAEALVLYTRQGCCLCEGLEERLRALEPAPPLECLDVDGDPELQGRYGLSVPVLAIRRPDGSLQELPRVSPRLAGSGLAEWLRRTGSALPAA